MCAHNTISQQIKKLKTYVKEHVIFINDISKAKSKKYYISYIPRKIKNFSMLNTYYTRPSKDEKSLSRKKMKI